MATDLRFPAWMGDVVARERARDAAPELVTALEWLVKALNQALASNEYGGDMPEEWEVFHNAEALLARLKSTPTG